MSFFGKLGKAVSVVAQTALPIVIAAKFPEAMVNTAVGGVVKHATPIPNGSIPVLNAVVSVGVAYAKHGLSTGDWHGAIGPALQEGLTWMTASTALHQSIKIPLGNAIGGELAVKVGPGPKFSI